MCVVFAWIVFSWILSSFPCPAWEREINLYFSLVQSSTIEPKHLACFIAASNSMTVARFETSGSICKIERAVNGIKEFFIKLYRLSSPGLTKGIKGVVFFPELFPIFMRTSLQPLSSPFIPLQRGTGGGGGIFKVPHFRGGFSIYRSIVF